MIYPYLLRGWEMSKNQEQNVEKTLMTTGSIETYKHNWAQALMEKGVVVNLHIGRWRAQSKLTPKDLGFDESDPELISFFKRYFNLGNKLLITLEMKRRMDTIESRGRCLLKRYSFDTVFGFFVPYTSFEYWNKESKNIEQEYLACRDEFVNTFETIINDAVKEYDKAAQQLWDRIPALQNSPKDSFVTAFIERLRNKIPSIDEIKNSFYYYCTFSNIPLPSFIADDVRKARIKSICANADEETVKKIANMCDSVAEEYVKKKSEIIDQFLDSTVKSLRVQIASLCDDVILSIEKHKKLAKNKIKHIQKTIKHLEMLNFFNDTEINENLQSVNKLLDGIEETENKDILADVKSSFKNVAIQSRKTMVGNFSANVERFANLEVT